MLGELVPLLAIEARLPRLDALRIQNLLYSTVPLVSLYTNYSILHDAREDAVGNVRLGGGRMQRTEAAR